MAESKNLIGPDWATKIRDRADFEGVMAVIAGVNGVTSTYGVNRACVIVACSQILAQCVATSDPEIAPEMRQGIAALIDAYAMEVAVARS